MPLILQVSSLHGSLHMMSPSAPIMGGRDAKDSARKGGKELGNPFRKHPQVGETIVADSTLLCPSTFGLPNSLRGAFPLFGIVPFTNIRQRCQRCHRWCGIAGLILQGQQWCVRFRGEAKPMVILGRLEYIAVFIHARAHLIFWLCSLFELLFNDRLHHFFR